MATHLLLFRTFSVRRHPEKTPYLAGNSNGGAIGGIQRLILLKRPPPVAVEI